MSEARVASNETRTNGACMPIHCCMLYIPSFDINKAKCPSTGCDFEQILERFDLEVLVLRVAASDKSCAEAWERGYRVRS